MKRKSDFQVPMSDDVDTEPENIEERIRNSSHHKSGLGAFSPHTDLSGTDCTYKCKSHKWRGKLLGPSIGHLCKRYNVVLEDSTTDSVFKLGSKRCSQCILEYGCGPVTRRQKQ